MLCSQILLRLGLARYELYNLPVSALGDDPRWDEAFPRLVQTGQDWKLRRLLQEAEAIHRSSAARFRALGWHDQARRAEQFAAWIRLDLDEPRAARRLYSAARALREVPRPGLLVTEILEGAAERADWALARKPPAEIGYPWSSDPRAEFSGSLRPARGARRVRTFHLLVVSHRGIFHKGQRSLFMTARIRNNCRRSTTGTMDG
jgi:hypothetical protein